MKIVFATLLLWLALKPAIAQDTTGTKTNAYLTVHQENAVTELQDKYKEYNRKKEFSDGYRIQIINANVRDEIYKSKAELYQHFPDLVSYIDYEQPNYKLKAGDFKTRLEATYYLQQVITVYPGAFIVKDKIKTQ